MKTVEDVLQWTRNKANNDMILACEELAKNHGDAAAFITGRAQAFREVGGYLEYLIKNGEFEVKEGNI